MSELHQAFLPQALQFAQNHPILVIGWIALFVMTIYFIFQDATRPYKLLSNEEAIRIMNADDAVIVDLRPLEEFERGHIVNSLNILPEEIKENKLGKLEKEKAKPVIVVDQMGINGLPLGKSAHQLAKLGFSPVYALKDGLAGWRGANLPLVNKHNK